MKDPKVSIIIPCYNTGKIIEETFASLDGQTNRNFEVIFINDGSSDDTLKRLHDFQSRTELSITIIDKPNGGVSAARNDGIRAANGKYIAFLDSDDVYHAKFIEMMLHAAESMHTDTVYCMLTRNFKELSTLDGALVEETADQAMNRLLFQMGSSGFYCYLYRTDILRANEILFDENTKYGEDRELIWKYIVHCKTFASIHAVLYGYRANPASATQKKASWRRADSLQAVRRVEQYMLDHHTEFYPTYHDYMYARDMWAVAKAFAITDSKECYDKLIREYDVKTCMKRTSRDNSLLVSLASLLFRIHPNLFFFCIRLMR